MISWINHGKFRFCYAANLRISISLPHLVAVHFRCTSAIFVRRRKHFFSWGIIRMFATTISILATRRRRNKRSLYRCTFSHLLPNLLQFSFNEKFQCSIRYPWWYALLSLRDVNGGNCRPCAIAAAAAAARPGCWWSAAACCCCWCCACICWSWTNCCKANCCCKWDSDENLDSSAALLLLPTSFWLSQCLPCCRDICGKKDV